MSNPMDSKLAEQVRELNGKREKYYELLHSKESILDFSEEEVTTQLQPMRKEIDDLAQKLEKPLGLWKAAEQDRKSREEWKTSANNIPNPGGDPGGTKGDPAQNGQETKSLGQLIASSADYKAGISSGTKRFGFDLPVNVKTLMTTSAGYAPANNRTPKVVLSAQQAVRLTDIIPSDTTELSVIKFMEETTFTNNAAPVAEAGTIAESALAFTERSNLVEVIATFLPVTMQQLEYVEGIEELLNNRLAAMVQFAEETQIVSGSGTSPQLIGFLNKAGLQTQAVGTDNIFDAIYKAINKVRGAAGSGFAEPSAIVLHPNDWEPFRLATTAEGVYILGSPADPDINRLWGLPVVITTRETENTGLLGDFALYSHISRKMGLRIDVSDSHSDFFIKNQLAIRAQIWSCLEIYRAASFAKVTGL